MSPGPEHADDLLSALLDDELDAATRAWVEGHVEACAPCRRAAVDLAEARALLRGLPTVDATPVIEGFLSRHRTLVRLGGAFVAVTGLVLAALAITAAPEHAAVVPEVAHLAAVHDAGSHGGMDGMVAVEGGGGYAAPPGLIGSSAQLSRQAVYDGSDLTAVVYRDAGVGVSVYQQPGRLDWDGLAPGEVADIGGRLVWFGSDPDVAVTELGDMVVTVVSEDRGALLTALGGLPEWRRRSTWDRVHDACQRFTQVFALGSRRARG